MTDAETRLHLVGPVYECLSCNDAGSPKQSCMHMRPRPVVAYRFHRVDENGEPVECVCNGDVKRIDLMAALKSGGKHSCDDCQGTGFETLTLTKERYNEIVRACLRSDVGHLLTTDQLPFDEWRMALAIAQSRTTK